MCGGNLIPGPELSVSDKTGEHGRGDGGVAADGRIYAG